MPSPLKSTDVSPSHSVKGGLGDYGLREPLLQYVLPHLRLANLGHLRASCRCLQSLLDDEHCHDVWAAASRHVLPQTQQRPKEFQAGDSSYAHPGSHAQMPPRQHQGSAGLSSNIVQQQQQQQQPLNVQNTALPCREQEQTVSADTTAADGNSPRPEQPTPEQQQQQQTCDNKQQQQQQQPACKRLQMGHDEQQHPGDCQAVNVNLVKAFSGALARDVQSCLRAQATFLRCLSEPPNIIRLPAKMDRHESTPTDLWSPCGTWVAVQRCKLQDALPHEINSLVIWDTVSRTVQEVSEPTTEEIFTIAWLPASSWLLWRKLRENSRTAPRFTFSCSNVVSGECHELQEEVRDVWTHTAKYSFTATSTGKMMAYTHGIDVMLLTMPHLKHQRRLSNPMRDTPSYAQDTLMSFNLTGSHIVVCWGRYKTS